MSLRNGQVDGIYSNKLISNQEMRQHLYSQENRLEQSYRAQIGFQEELKRFSDERRNDVAALIRVNSNSQSLVQSGFGNLNYTLQAVNQTLSDGLMTLGKEVGIATFVLNGILNSGQKSLDLLSDANIGISKIVTTISSTNLLLSDISLKIDKVIEGVTNPRKVSGFEDKKDGIECYRNGWYEDAMRLFQSSAKNLITDSEVFFMMGLIYLENFNDLDKANESFCLAIKYSDKQDQSIYSASLSKLAIIYFIKGDIKRALEYQSKIPNIEKNDIYLFQYLRYVVLVGDKSNFEKFLLIYIKYNPINIVNIIKNKEFFDEDWKVKIIKNALLQLENDSSDKKYELKKVGSLSKYNGLGYGLDSTLYYYGTPGREVIKVDLGYGKYRVDTKSGESNVFSRGSFSSPIYERGFSNGKLFHEVTLNSGKEGLLVNGKLIKESYDCFQFVGFDRNGDYIALAGNYTKDVGYEVGISINGEKPKKTILFTHGGKNLRFLVSSDYSRIMAYDYNGGYSVNGEYPKDKFYGAKEGIYGDKDKSMFRIVEVREGIWGVSINGEKPNKLFKKAIFEIYDTKTGNFYCAFKDVDGKFGISINGEAPKRYFKEEIFRFELFDNGNIIIWFGDIFGRNLGYSLNYSNPIFFDSSITTSVYNFHQTPGLFAFKNGNGIIGISDNGSQKGINVNGNSPSFFCDRFELKFSDKNGNRYFLVKVGKKYGISINGEYPKYFYDNVILDGENFKGKSYFYVDEQGNIYFCVKDGNRWGISINGEYPKYFYEDISKLEFLGILNGKILVKIKTKIDDNSESTQGIGFYGEELNYFDIIGNILFSKSGDFAFSYTSRSRKSDGIGINGKTSMTVFNDVKLLSFDNGTLTFIAADGGGNIDLYEYKSK